MMGGGEDDLNLTISDAMQTRDNSERTCSCALNCLDMWCMRSHPDQVKIFKIQTAKQGALVQQQDASSSE